MSIDLNARPQLIMHDTSPDGRYQMGILVIDGACISYSVETLGDAPSLPNIAEVLQRAYCVPQDLEKLGITSRPGYLLEEAGV